MADLGLADTVHASEALFNPVRVPGQVVIHHQVGALQVDAFAGRIGGYQHLYLGVTAKGVLGVVAFFTFHAAVDQHHCFRPALKGGDALLQIRQGVPVFCEDHQLLAWRGLGLRDIPGAVRQFRFADTIPDAGGSENLLQQATQLLPLGIDTAVAHPGGQRFQLFECIELRFQFGYGTCRGCLVQQPFFGILNFVPRRILQVFQVLLAQLHCW